MKYVLGGVQCLFGLSWGCIFEQNIFEIENYGEKEPSDYLSALPSGTFSFSLTLFKTALVSIIFILELSVLDKSCLELNFQAIDVLPRVPCMPVFLRSHISDSLSDFFDDIQKGHIF